MERKETNMTKKWKGSHNDLRSTIKSSNIQGSWSIDVKNKHTFHSLKGGILNWWPKTYTMQFQGSKEGKRELENIFNQTSFESKKDEFQKGLEGLINTHEIENICDIPDFILAETLVKFIQIFDDLIKKTLHHRCSESEEDPF